MQCVGTASACVPLLATHLHIEFIYIQCLCNTPIATVFSTLHEELEVGHSNNIILCVMVSGSHTLYVLLV